MAKSNKKKNARIKEYKALFACLGEDVNRMIEQLIINAVDLEFYIMDIKEQLEKVGFVEEYQNGENQFGKKQSTESRAYNDQMKLYINTLNTLQKFIPNNAPKEVSDGLEEFIKQAKRK